MGFVGKCKKIKSAVDCTLLFWKFFLKKVLTFGTQNYIIHLWNSKVRC